MKPLTIAMQRLLRIPYFQASRSTTLTTTRNLTVNTPFRAMSTTNPPSTTTPSDISSSPSHSGQNPGSSQPLPLPEPPKDTNAATLDVSSGQGVKLDHLGPMVVNRDGTLSRIANWTEMSDIERKNTLRILGKRNQLRINALKNDDNKD